MSQYSVQITDRAELDMEEIYGYIADTLQAPDVALKQYQRIAEGILSLAEFPERCQALEFHPEPGVLLRRLLVDNYSVIYLAASDRVVIQRVLYSAMDIDARLAEL